MKKRSSKQAKAREFDKKTREKIWIRDGGCIFCKMNYRMEHATWYGKQLMGIMHYIPRSKNGLGIVQNGAVGCQYHHEMLDNGNSGNRKEMLELFEAYLKEENQDWSRKDLTYTKWR